MSYGCAWLWYLFILYISCDYIRLIQWWLYDFIAIHSSWKLEDGKLKVFVIFPLICMLVTSVGMRTHERECAGVWPACAAMWCMCGTCGSAVYVQHVRECKQKLTAKWQKPKQSLLEYLKPWKMYPRTWLLLAHTCVCTRGVTTHQSVWWINRLLASSWLFQLSVIIKQTFN